MITFEHQLIPVKIGPRRKRGETMPRLEQVDAMVGIGTNMAYHQPPAGTVIHKKLPDAYVITDQESHSLVTCSLLPADAPTAEACIAYLSEHMEHPVSAWQLIDQFAQTQGRWCRVS